MTTTAGRATEWPLVGRSVDLERALTALGDPAVRVVHLHGDAGAGKTRLATELLRGAELDGFPVAQVVATPASTTLPLSALTPLLPPGLREDAAGVLDAVADHVRDLGDGARVVVHVDDVDHLDVVSCDLLARLWREDLVVVVATQRAGTATPAVLIAEQRAGGVLRIEVGDLPRASVASLLHHVLRGPVSGGTEHALWTASAGNPLYLRELVTGALLSGRLAQTDGVWVLDGALDVTGGLAGVVAERIGELDDEGRALLDLLALCAPLGVDELATHTSFALLERLEATGVISVVPSHRRQQVSLAHPVYAQVIQQQLPRLKARRLLLDQVARTEEHGARRRDDALRLAAWRLDATGTADAGLLVTGARLARSSQDYAQVERLVQAALLLEPDVTASTLLGEALYELGRFEEADQVLADAWRGLEDRSTEEAVLLALHHGIVLFFGLARPDEALHQLAEASEAVESSGLPAAEAGQRRAVLDAMRALLLTQGARSAEALAVMPAVPPASPDMRPVYWRARGWSLFRTGRAEEALDAAQAGWFEGTGEDATPGFLHAEGDLMVAAFSQLELGRPEEARATAARGRDSAIGHGALFQAAWLAWVVATIDLVTGYAEDARGAFRELMATSARHGFPQVERLAAFGLAECAALLGEAEEASSWVERAETLPEPAPAYAHTEVVSRAWVLVVGGDARAAAALVLERGRELAARGELREAAVLLDEAVMFGNADAARELLEVVASIDTPVGRARGLRATAMLSGSPSDLLAAAGAFGECGFVHSAAQMAAKAAQILRADGDPRAAAAAEAQARTWADRSPGIEIDGLGSTAGAALLTPREKEIASLVARGRTSKEVAADLVLSVRTVDNHLANVYAKLGIPGRAQLASALGLAQPASIPAARSGDPR